MRTERIALVLSTVVMILTLPGCDWSGESSSPKGPARESIFDRVVSIPKELVLDIPQLPPLCDEIKDLKKGFVEVPNGKLYYEEEGSGIPLVLLHGGPGGTHHVFHPYFSQMKDLARVIYYDQRGTGKSGIDETGVTYTIKQAVEDLEYLRKALKIEKWVVFGWSYGGFLAQCYALTYPEHMLGLVLDDSGPGLIEANKKPSRTEMFLSQQEKEALCKVSQAYEENKLSLEQRMYNSLLVGEWKRQGYYKPTFEQMARTALYEWSPALGFSSFIGSDIRALDLKGKFDDFEIPTLLMEAKWDLTWDMGKADLMRKNHPQAQFAYFEKSGHGIFQDEPEKFFSILRAFLKKANETSVNYKPGNRLTWPKPSSEFIRKLIMAKSITDKVVRRKELVELYQQALNENNTDAQVWKVLIGAFGVNVEHAEKSLNALQRYVQYAAQQEPAVLKELGFRIEVLRGNLLDLLGRRGEAVKNYQQALLDYKGGNIDEERRLKRYLEVPFTPEERKS